MTGNLIEPLYLEIKRELINDDPNGDYGEIVKLISLSTYLHYI